ncbi:MAG: preprotein translocase subunit YajC [Alphaproteobacteria bacterium]|nr:preprotein translocase subunit YajC [Alphaproteobacteria bacterium]
MFISMAFAQGAEGGGGLFGGGGGIVSLLPLVLIFVVFYFLLIRPQQKKVKVHRAMVGNLRRGDNIVTGGGIIGKVTKVLDDNRVEVEIADGVRVQVARGTIQDVVTRSEPVPEDNK